MACNLSMQCDLIFGFLKCALPEDLKVHNLKRIHTFRKDYKLQKSKCSPWRTLANHSYPLYQQNLPTKAHSSSKETKPGTTYQTKYSQTFPTKKNKCREIS